SWISKCSIRTVYWLDRPYNLLEVYGGAGELEETYLNVASPPIMHGRQVSFVDHELDVTLRPGGQPRVVDEDEFEEAAARFSYAPDFQAACRRGVGGRGWVARLRLASPHGGHTLRLTAGTSYRVCARALSGSRRSAA